MAKIPTAMGRVGSVAPATPTIGSQFLSQGYSDLAQARGQMGSAFAQVGQQLLELNSTLLKEMEVAGLQSSYANAKTETEVAFQDWMAQLPFMDISEEGGESGNYKNYAKYIDGFEEFQTELYENIRGGLKHPDAQGAYDEWFGMTMTQNRGKVLDYRIAQELDQYGADYQARVELYRKNRDKDGLVSDTRTMVERGIISEAMGQATISAETQAINRLMVEDTAIAMGYEAGTVWLAETTEPMEQYGVTSGEQLAILNKLRSAHAVQQNRINQEQQKRDSQGFYDAVIQVREGKYWTAEELDGSGLSPSVRLQILTYQDAWARTVEADNDNKLDMDRTAFLNDMDWKIATDSFTEADALKMREIYPDVASEYMEAYRQQEDRKLRIAAGEQDARNEQGLLNWEAQLSSHMMAGSYDSMQGMINQMFTHPNPRIQAKAEHWVNQLEQARASGAAGGKSIWEISSDAYQTQYYEKLWDPTVSFTDLQTWVTRNYGPDGAGNPRIGFSDYDRWMGEIEGIKTNQRFVGEGAKEGYRLITGWFHDWKQGVMGEELLEVMQLEQDTIEAYYGKYQSYSEPYVFAQNLLKPMVLKSFGLIGWTGEAKVGGAPSYSIGDIDWAHQQWEEGLREGTGAPGAGTGDPGTRTGGADAPPPTMNPANRELPVGTPPLPGTTSDVLSNIGVKRDGAYVWSITADGTRAIILGQDGNGNYVWVDIDPALIYEYTGETP